MIANTLVVGRFFITLEDRHGNLVVGEGNRIARPYWRKGHNRQTRLLLFRYVFEELGADRIDTEVWSENTNSIRSIESHGFRFVREEIRMNEKYRKAMLMRYYRLARDEWRNSAPRRLGVGS